MITCTVAAARVASVFRSDMAQYNVKIIEAIYAVDIGA